MHEPIHLRTPIGETWIVSGILGVHLSAIACHHHHVSQADVVRVVQLALATCQRWVDEARCVCLESVRAVINEFLQYVFETIKQAVSFIQC